MEERILDAITENINIDKDKYVRKIAVDTLRECTKQNFSHKDITKLIDYINILANNIALDSSVFVVDAQSS